MKYPPNTRYSYSPIIFPEGFKLVVCENVYPPDEDSYIMLDALSKVSLSKDFIGLDMGCGSGILTCFLAKKIKHVFAVDINPYAINCTVNNLILNDLSKKVTVLYSNLFSSIPQDFYFDLVVFNPPYLPSDEFVNLNIYSDLYSIGGLTGVEIILKFLDEVVKHLSHEGVILLLISSLLDEHKVKERINSLNLRWNVLLQKKLFFETLKVLLITT